jgi:hypothetical protein
MTFAIASLTLANASIASVNDAVTLVAEVTSLQSSPPIASLS